MNKTVHIEAQDRWEVWRAARGTWLYYNFCSTEARANEAAAELLAPTHVVHVELPAVEWTVPSGVVAT